MDASPARPLPVDGDLPAGRFSTWLTTMRAALAEGTRSDVPCNGCTACCRASQFVPIGPDERDTLAHIPRELLVAAPRMPPGHVVLGYDRAGRCPMLGEEGCSIYEHRPRACRTYDCRVYPAAGVGHDDEDGPVARQARRWHFDLADAADEAALAAVRAAARFVERHGEGDDRRPDGSVTPPSPTRVAVLAIKLAETFAGRDGEPTVGEVRVALRRGAPPAEP